MSMMLMVKAMQTKVGNPLRKLVLIKLADNANDAGECWPSYQHVADQCEISRSTVKNHVRELEKSGLLRREYRKSGELNQSNVFHLALDGGAGAALGGAGAALGGAGAALGGGAGDDPRISHSLEPINEPPIEPKDSMSKPAVIDDRVKQVIGLLNSLTGSKYRASTKSHAGHISERLNDGHSVDDIMAVVRFKVQEWLHDPKMAQYLRPETLFQAGKFNGYLTAAKATQGPLAGLSAISRKNAQNLAGWLNEE